jgi:uncharacterized membrane protein (UPF0127 family)
MRTALVVALALAVAFGAGHASPPLPVTTVTVDTQRGPKTFTVEVASDMDSQQRGLMYRRYLAADAGMLFDFHKAMMISFWMKNTVLPLDLVFIRADGTISTVASNAVPFSTALIPSAEPVRAVLEINGGRAHDLGIRVGDRVRAAIFRETR